MAVSQNGYYANGLTIAAGSQVSPSAVFAGDTQAPNGSPPQTLGYTLGTIGSTMSLGTIGATAFAGGGQTNATLLGYGINTVTTVATAADSVKLPPAVAGRTVFIRNVAANATQVFGGGTSTVNGVATATGVSQAATSGVWYVCTSGTGDDVAGTWVRT